MTDSTLSNETSSTGDRSAARPSTGVLVADDIMHEYGAPDTTRRVLENLSFTVGAGEFVSIVGPSGCGKSTLLRCISGLMKPTAGSVALDGAVYSGVPRELALVFQDYSRSLFPWLTVAGNVRFALSGLKLSKAEVNARIDESLHAVGLGDIPGQYPWQLSGGMQQRVAIARALAYRPKILLLDEPFASVDAQTRAELEDLLLNVWAKFGMTVLFVTHDIDESVYQSDRVVVLGSSPTCVIADVEIPIARPRHQIHTRELPEFTELRSHLARLIRAAKEAPRNAISTDSTSLRP
ncbi:ABC transporter ATP-binding protein [Specibacter sp. RAF43]|uniref:ABC transporter ATP-binding protein n=1 Tax=Specibacter sp. RAF43 TaxID=3233057 RepID=UPI003F9856C3